MFEEGINPTVVNEEEADVTEAKAGSDLFESTNNQEYTVDSDALFVKTMQEQELQEESRDLFTHQVVLSSPHKTVTETVNGSQQVTSLIVIVVCILVIVSYVYYLVQKRSIKKNIKISYEKVMNI